MRKSELTRDITRLLWEGDNTEYFDTWPMIMVECNEDRINVVKSNMTFNDYVKENFPNTYDQKEFNTKEYTDKNGRLALDAVIQCAKDGRRVIIDDVTKEGKLLQLLVWRVAVNPVTNVAAVMIAILSATDVRNNKSVEIEELKKSVSALLTNMPAMTFSKDVNTRKYLACNQAFADYAHKDSPEGVVGLTDFEIFDEATAYHFIEDDKKALAMDKPYIFYEDVPDAQGNPRQFQTTKLKFTDDT